MPLRDVLAAVLLLATAPALAQEAVPVEVPGGTVAGAAVGSDLVFRGIPFAASPLGELRWRPPARKPRKAGTRPRRIAGRKTA